jgi:hypothetical protein
MGWVEFCGGPALRNNFEVDLIDSGRRWERKWIRFR